MSDVPMEEARGGVRRTRSRVLEACSYGVWTAEQRELIERVARGLGVHDNEMGTARMCRAIREHFSRADADVARAQLGALPLDVMRLITSMMRTEDLARLAASSSSAGPLLVSERLIAVERSRQDRAERLFSTYLAFAAAIFGYGMRAAPSDDSAVARNALLHYTVMSVNARLYTDPVDYSLAVPVERPVIVVFCEDLHMRNYRNLREWVEKERVERSIASMIRDAGQAGVIILRGASQRAPVLQAGDAHVEAAFSLALDANASSEPIITEHAGVVDSANDAAVEILRRVPVWTNPIEDTSLSALAHRLADGALVRGACTVTRARIRDVVGEVLHGPAAEALLQLSSRLMADKFIR